MPRNNNKCTVFLDLSVDICVEAANMIRGPHVCEDMTAVCVRVDICDAGF